MKLLREQVKCFSNFFEPTERFSNFLPPTAAAPAGPASPAPLLDPCAGAPYWTCTPPICCVCSGFLAHARRSRS